MNIKKNVRKFDNTENVNKKLPAAGCCCCCDSEVTPDKN